MTIDPETIAALIEKHGALQNPREVAHLLRFLEQHPPRLIVEVGVWQGGNAAILKTFFPDARIIGVDELDTGSPRVPLLADNIRRFGIELVTGNSNLPATAERVRAMIPAGQKADYLFIDAAHDYDSVKRDFAVWSPLANFVGFHDVHNPEVLRFWMEVCAFDTDHARPAALWKEMDGHGIGVVCA